MTSIEPDFRPGNETAPDGSRPPPPQPLQVGPSDRRAQRAIAFVEVVLCSGFPTQILLTPILILGGLRPFGIDGQLSLAFVVTLSLVDAAVLIVLILSFLRIHHEGPRDLFLGARPIGHESMTGMFLIPVVILGVLSFSILVDSSKHAGISWDGLLSCEFLGHYKPDKEAYLAATRLLRVSPEEAMMVAVHPGDLRAARNAGFRTGYVAPKLEEPGSRGETTGFDIVAEDYADFVRQICGFDNEGSGTWVSEIS